VDERNEAGFDALCHPQFTLLWPQTLQARNFRQRDSLEAQTWEEVWDPFQPIETFPTRKLDPRIIASCGNRVTALWHQRGINADGEAFHTEVLGLYEVRDGLLFSGQMFYFDGVETRRFLESAPSV
jgi:SnoaL-like domain